ncbi:MAG: hypothetical protein R3261_14425, partial [Alphaproteobacteria bacterium]|nr:hypothetical protein [Alphaproteobacteria bacterium]
MPSRVAESTSQLFAKNLLNFLTPMLSAEEGAIKIDREDDIIKGSMVCHDGEVTESRVAELLKANSASGSKTAPEKQSSDSSEKAKSSSKKAASKKATSKKTGAKKSASKKAASKKTAAKKAESKSADKGE